MFVDLFERGIFEGFNGASLLSVVAFGQNRPVLDDLDTSEFFEDPALRRIVCELGLFRFEALVHCRQAFELLDIGAGIERHPFDQCQDRRRAFQRWYGRWLNRPFPLLGLAREAGLLLHQVSSVSHLGSAFRRSLNLRTSISSDLTKQRWPRPAAGSHTPPGARLCMPVML